MIFRLNFRKVSGGVEFECNINGDGGMSWKGDRIDGNEPV